MPNEDFSFESIVQEVRHDGLTFDVRSYLVPHSIGVVLIDTGMPGGFDLIASGLERIGVTWADVTDVVLTHKHFDHVANLAAVVESTPSVSVWAGIHDAAQIPFEGSIRPLSDGENVRNLRAVATPGHTSGHVSFLHEDTGTLFAGDVAGTMGGLLTRGPAQFTEDASRAEQTLRELASIEWERLVLAHGDEVADPRGDLAALLTGAPPHKSS